MAEYNTGILQHAVFHLPNYNEGYTTDDNARALVLAVLLDRLTRRDGLTDIPSFISRCLAFVWHAFNPKATIDFGISLVLTEGGWENSVSEDNDGRALWSLG